MDRQRLYKSWASYYLSFLGLTPSEAIVECLRRADEIRRRMVSLARKRQAGKARVQGIPIRAIESALGMSYGVHKQLSVALRGVDIRSPRGGKIEGWRAGQATNFRLAKQATFQNGGKA